MRPLTTAIRQVVETGRRGRNRTDAKLQTLYQAGLKAKEVGRLDVARARYERAIALSAAVTGLTDDFTVQLRNDLAAVLVAQGNLAAAHGLRELALALQRDRTEPHPAAMVAATNDLATVLLLAGESAAAALRFQAAADLAERHLAPQDPQRYAALIGLSRTRAAHGDLAGAAQSCQQAADLPLGQGHPDLAAARRDLELLASGADLRRRRTLALHKGHAGFEEAAEVSLVLGALADARRYRGRQAALCIADRAPVTAMAAMNNLAASLREERDFTGAVLLYQRAETMVPDPPLTLLVANRYGAGASALMRGDAGTALACYQQVVSTNVARLGPDHSETQTAITHRDFVRAIAVA